MFSKLISKLKTKKKGFTLIELIVVIAIIAILAAILVPTMLGFLGDARQTAADANARTGYTVATAYVTQENTNNEAGLDMTGAADATLGSTPAKKLGPETATVKAIIAKLGDNTFTGDLTVYVDEKGEEVLAVTWKGAKKEVGVHPTSQREAIEGVTSN